MKIKDKLAQVRPRPTTQLSMRQMLLRTLFICVFGAVLGFLSKYIDVLPHFGGFGDFLNLMSDISSRLAIISPLAAYIIWYSRGKGWIAAISAALPIGMLLAEGYGFFHTFSVTQGFELVLALLLYVFIPTGQKFQRLRLIPPIVVVGFILRKFDVISLLLGIIYKWI